MTHPTPKRRPSEYDLARRQLDGIARWHERRQAFERSIAAGRRSREQRLDLARRMDVLREQQRAIITRTQQQLSDGTRLLGARPRAVVAHRNAWFIDKITAVLVEGGVEVVARPVNGAEAVGVAVAEQPDLLLVEDALPMLPGDAVVREVLACAPTTLVCAQVGYDDAIGRMLDAGASAAFARRVPPADIAAHLLWLLAPVPV